MSPRDHFFVFSVEIFGYPIFQVFEKIYQMLLFYFQSDLLTNETWRENLNTKSVV